MVQSSKIKDLGLVSQCNVSSCTYNQKQLCTAGAVDVTFMNAVAQCYTYTELPESEVRVEVGFGDVSQCDVIDCTYNVGQGCKAETITVALINEVAQCATYSNIGRT